MRTLQDREAEIHIIHDEISDFNTRAVVTCFALLIGVLHEIRDVLLAQKGQSANTLPEIN